MTDAIACLPQAKWTAARTLLRPIAGWIPNQVWNDEIEW
jgi:hypothetical protein